MKLSTLVFGFIVCATIGGMLAIIWRVTEHSRAWNQLSSLAGRDLSKLGAKDALRLERALAKLIPGRNPPRLMGYEPWAVWILQSGTGPVRTALFEVNRSGMHPGSTDIRLTTFREGGRLSRITEFDMGHRTYLNDFALKNTHLTEYPVLELSSSIAGELQIYGIIDDAWALIRMEQGGRAARPYYFHKRFRCGPEVRPSGVAEVERALHSSNAAEVLAMMTWLGAYHKAASPEEASPQFQEPGEVAIHTEARNHPSVIKRLEELAKSSKPWIREAAGRVLRQ